VAYLFQLLSRIHSQFRYLNCHLDFHPNQRMMFHAICLGVSRLRCLRCLVAPTATARSVRVLARMA